MDQCPYEGCAWQAIAPSEEAARGQYADHIVAEHARIVEADIPEGMVQIKLGTESEWITTTHDEARRLHDAFHGD